jgi:hypothetical protein
MANLLLIISREYPERYEFLKRAFASRKEVEVMLDRRSPAATPPNQDRRARRTETQLRTHGWVLVRRLPAPAKTTAPSARAPAAAAKAPAPAAARSRAPKPKAAAKRSGTARRGRARA